MKGLFFGCAILYLLNTSATTKEQVIDLHERCYSYLDTNLDSALILSQEAEDISHEQEFDYLEAQSLFIKAYIYRVKDDMGKSFVTNLEALHILNTLETLDAIKTHVQVLLNTGEILKQHYAYAQAVEYYDEGINQALRYELTDWAQRLLYNKAVALKHYGALDEALRAIEQSYELAIRNEDDLRILRSINQRGLILKDQGEFVEARRSFMEIVEHNFNKQSPERHLGHAWHNIGVTYVAEEKLSLALQAYQKALDWRLIKPKASDIFITYLDLADVYYQVGAHSKADSIAELAQSYYDDVSLSPDYYKLFDLRTEISFQLGQLSDVHLYAQRYIDENGKFLVLQKDILQVKDQYKMEVLTAGFFTELDAKQTQSELHRYLLSSVAFFTLIILIGRFRYFWKKWAIKKGLSHIEKDSDV